MNSTKMFFVRRKAIVWPWSVNHVKTLAVESVFLTKDFRTTHGSSNTISWSVPCVVRQN